MIPTDESNLICRALNRLKNSLRKETRSTFWECQCNCTRIFRFRPALGGASGNAAASLLAGNHLWGLKLAFEQVDGDRRGTRIGHSISF